MEHEKYFKLNGKQYYAQNKEQYLALKMMLWYDARDLAKSVNLNLVNKVIQDANRLFGPTEFKEALNGKV